MLLLYLLVFLVAAIYATVGFGGASGYIALMILFDVPYHLIAPVALICNTIVSFGGTIHFWHKGYLDWRFTAPFVILSVPCAYLGGSTPIGKGVFQLVLGTALFAAGLRMVFFSKKPFDSHKKPQWIIASPLGGGLGLLSGLVGIGGGIFLAPVLYVLRWGGPKKIAATASAFILINSLFALVGQIQKMGGVGSIGSLWPMYLSVFLGGQLGSWVCNIRIPRRHLELLTALLVLLVSGRLIFAL